MIFLINCGGCSEWRRDSASVHLGLCTRFNEARHDRRELCAAVWDEECKRLIMAAGLDLGVEDLDAVLNPRLALEKAGAQWPEGDGIERDLRDVPNPDADYPDEAETFPAGRKARKKKTKIKLGDE